MPAPTATITLDRTIVNGSQTAIVTIRFDQPVNGFDVSALTSGYGELTWLGGSDGDSTYTATFTPNPDQPSTLTSVSLDLSSITSAPGEIQAEGSPTSPDFTVDTRPPSVTINLDDYSLTVGEDATVTFTFSEEVKPFTADDLNVANGAITGLAVTGDPKIWLGTFTPTASVENATNLISLKTGAVTDLAGNAGTGTSGNYAVDTKAPTVTVAMGNTNLSIGETSTVTFTFSEAVADFDLTDDVTAPGGSLSGLTATGPNVFTATFTAGSTTNATNVITLKDASVTDLIGNANSGATDSNNNYAIDADRPTVTIAMGNTNLSIGETSTVTFTFSEAVADFDLTDVTKPGGSLSGLTATGNPNVFTATFTAGSTTNATNVITLNDASVTDLAGNANSGATDSNNYAIDADRPTAAAITLANSALVTGQSTGVTIKFSEAVTGFEMSDLAIEGGTLSAVNSADGGVTWTATFTAGAITDATNVITLDSTNVSDLAGNAGTGTLSSANYTISPYVPPVQPDPTTPNTPTAGNDVIALPATGGTISAGEGADSVTGAAGDDFVHGNVGDDSLSGGGGDDIVRGGQGSDFVHGNTGDDQIFGDIGDDTAHGGQGGDLIQGNVGDDIVSGDLGNDTVLGGQGHDVVLGGAGDDYVSGDLGSDILSGGTGADLFNFSGGSGRDKVIDFSRAEGDQIRISPSDAANFSALSITSQGADTLITLGAQTVILIGVSASSLTAADFVFA